LYFSPLSVFSRDLIAHRDALHPCWTAAHFLPCTRPPDVLRLPRAQRGRIHTAPLHAASFGARARAPLLTPPAPERTSPPADLRTALRPPASFGVTLFAINVGRPAGPRTPGRIHSEDHIISLRFSPPSTGRISGGYTSLFLCW
jgi:hypothetical protein